jgi:acyl-coenzyme A synthetase/AMP-(fatty) acid ligase
MTHLLILVFDLYLQECGITGRKYTYEMTRQLIRRFGSALTRMGYKKGEVFGIISPNIPEFPIVLYGASGAGMPVSLVNPTFTAGIINECFILVYHRMQIEINECVSCVIPQRKWLVNCLLSVQRLYLAWLQWPRP